MRYIVLMVLVMGAMVNGVDRPVYEYTGTSNQEIIVSRNSLIVDGVHVTKAANTLRTQTVTSMTAAVPIVGSRSTQPWAVDSVNYVSDALLCVNQTNNKLLEYTLNLSDYTTILDLDTYTAAGDEQTINDYGAVQRIIVSGGTWYLSAGETDSAYSEGTYTGALFKSSDKGVTWTNILKTEHGIIFPVVNGDLVLAGEYHDATNDTTVGRDMYLSEDGGGTFVRIWDYEEPASLAVNNHFHIGYIIDSDNVIACYGDGDNGKIWKLSRPADWNGTDNWTRVELLRKFTVGQIAEKNGTLYLRKEDATVNYFTEEILKYNISTGNLDGTLKIPAAVASPTSTPYTYTTASHTNGYGIANVDGVLYASVFLYSGNCADSGVLASSDGINWSYCFRNPAIRGPKVMVGGMTIGGVRYAVGAYVNSDASTTTVAYPTSGISSRSSVCVQKGFTNHLARPRATFDYDQWTQTDSTTFDGLTTLTSAPADLLSNGFKYTSSDGTQATQGLYRAAIDLRDAYFWAGHYPDVNDYISFHFWYKTSALFGSDNYDTSQKTIWSVLPGSAIWLDESTENQIMPFVTSFRPFACFNKCDASANGTSAKGTYTFTCRSTPDSFREGLETTFDRLTFIYSPDRWYENPAPLMTTISSNGTITAGVVADEYLVVPEAVEAKTFTVVFDWYPLSGYKSYPYSVTYPTLPILSVIGTAGTYIDLVWDRENNKLKLIDADSDASLTPATAAINWKHNDCLKIALTCTGVNSILYVWHPENFAVNSDADGILTTGTGADGIGLSNIPIAFRLGTDHAESNIGAGAFTNIRVFDSALSASDVATVFNTLSKMLPTSGSSSGGIFGGGSIFGGN